MVQLGLNKKIYSMFIKPIPSIIRKVLYLFLFVSVSNCNQETNEEFYNSVVPSNESLSINDNYIIKEIKLNELTDIKERVYSSLFSEVFKSNARNEDPFVSSQNVLEVDNLKGIKNYSIKLNFKDQEAHVIYNIVIGKNYEGKIIQENVIEYICSENSRDEFINSDYNFQYFNGIVKVYDYDRFFKDSQFEYKLPTECPDQFDANGDPIPCTESTVSSGGSSTGGDGDSGSYSGDTGGETSGPMEGISGPQEYIIVCQDISCRNPILEPVHEDRKMALDGCDDCSGPSSGAGVNTDSDIFEDRINSSELSDCMKPIMSKIDSLSNNLGETIKKLSGEDPKYNWTTMEGSLGDGVVASTGPPSSYDAANGNISTVFDSQQYPNSTDLSWVRTILHESWHAYLAIFFEVNPVATFKKTYPNMVEEWPKYSNWNDIHHEEFTRTVVNEIASALEEYGKSQGYNLASSYYQDLAWGGLESTSAFTKKSTDEQNRIKDVIRIELTGKNSNGETKTQKGNKAGC